MAKPGGSIRNLELVVWVGFGIALIGVLISLVGIFTGPAARTRPVEMSPYNTATSADDPAPLPTGPPGAVSLVKPAADYTLVIADPSVSQRFLFVLPDLLLAVIMSVIAGILLLVIRTFDQDDPFVPPNARRLSVIGVLLLSLNGIPVVEKLVLEGLLSGTPLKNMPIRSAENFYWALIVGLAALALAEVFRQGSKLRADTQGLV
ncbi:Protein of unknown function [Streptosporangium subroseum]|uniref:DUF2975 domain-containing protein n=1 Tax=Streptosporangium subroseum TaxID=106412 RepID=A0A239KX51_9ACTN|nr:DUF2975 domain-containing protein [Streptosporangium subroseum]SNT22218.1 Protein of unknown function [Streptosporangium subroseum]